MSLRLKFVGFWSSFDEVDNLFTQILRKNIRVKFEIVNSLSKADLEICSVFNYAGSLARPAKYLRSKFRSSDAYEYEAITRFGYVPRDRKNATRRIWYNGEHFRTPYGSADGYVGCEKDDSIQNIIYFPHWMYRLFWERGQESGNVESKIEYFLSNRKIDSRKLEACLFSTSRDPRRIFLMQELGKFMKVDGYGRAFDKVVSDKEVIASKYALQICPENTIVPGYVTEKLIESWAYGNVAIWEGKDSFGYFNQEAFFDVSGFNSSEIQETFSSMDRAAIDEMRNRPILKKMPSLSPLIDLIDRVVN